MTLPQSQPDQEVDPIVEVVLLVVTGESKDGKHPFYYPGQFQWKEPTILRPGVKGDQPLLLREPKMVIVMPEITRTFADFFTFAAEHSVLLVRITIQELINELAKRGRLLAGDSVGADAVWALLENSVMTGFRREVIALMNLSLFFFGNTELVFMFIFCFCKYSPVTISKIIKLILENKYKSLTFALPVFFPFHQCPKYKS